jgi:SAM-dependent methyltransferase
MAVPWDVFERLADRYDEWFSRNKLIAESEARLIESFPAERPIAEVGVGTGFFAARVGADLGVDPAEAMLKLAKRRGIEVVQAIAERLPIRSGSLGTVLLVVTLCFLDDPASALAEAARALKPGGSLIACIVPADSAWGRHYTSLASAGHPFYSGARFYTLADVDGLAASYGLSRVEARGVLGYPPGSPPRLEDPRPVEDPRAHGFVCARYIKISQQGGGLPGS